jgi:hypothetical protein
VFHTFRIKNLKIIGRKIPKKGKLLDRQTELMISIENIFWKYKQIKHNKKKKLEKKTF